MASGLHASAAVVFDENMENMTAVAAAAKTPAKTGRSMGAAATASGVPGGGPGAAAHRRPALQDLTPNTSMSRQTEDERAGAGTAKKSNSNSSVSLSPLKRPAHRDVPDRDRGFTYLKRRRLSHGQAVSNAGLFRQERREGAARAVQLQHQQLQQQLNQQEQQSPARARPLSPPSSGKDAAAAVAAATAARPAPSSNNVTQDNSPTEKESDEDSGRESQNSNNTRGSFSSLINYDPSSQQALASQALNLFPPSVAAHTTHTPTRHSTSLSDTVRAQAEMLRLRLKVALYKVRTNQINVPFSRLRVPAPPPTPAVSVPHIHTNPQARTSPVIAADSLPTPPRARQGRQEGDLPYGLGITTAPDSTPNVFSNRYMPMSMQRAPSSSPPLIHVPPPSSLPRHAMAMETPFMGRVSHDHDSLDSEATELAEDMHDGHEHAESPSQARRPLYATGLGLLPR